MLPPYDPWQHQNLKLQEALENIRNIEVPPPAYMITENTESFVNQGVEVHFEDGEDEAPHMPVSVAIDASIAIDGQNNNVILPDPNPSMTPQGSSSASNSSLDNAGRVASMTESVIRALQTSNIIKASGAGQRPINLSINASIRIKGEKNVVFSGSKPAKKTTLSPIAGHDSVPRNDGQTGERELDQKATRKRRADSEGLCPPVGKQLNAG